MIFTVGIILSFLGFTIGHHFGDPRSHVYNPFDVVGCVLFISGMGCVFTSIFTLTWRYMP